MGIHSEEGESGISGKHVIWGTNNNGDIKKALRKKY